MNRETIQKTALKALKNNNYIGTVCLSTGSGKALPNSEPVLTSNGWKLNGELTLNDKVIGSDGTFKDILGIFPQGEREIYKITFDDGSYSLCDKEHLWTVNEKSKRNFVTVPLSYLLKRKIKNNQYDKRYGTIQEQLYFKIPLVNEVNFYQDINLPLDPYTLGILLGDGSFRDIPTLTLSNPEIKDKLIFPDGLSMKVYDIRKGCIQYGISNDSKKYQINPLTTILKDLGLFNKLSVEKHIPQIYLNASINDRKNLLQGLIDTDGHQIGNQLIEYSTSSERLAKDVMYLLRSLGISAVITDRIPTYSYNNEKKEGIRNYRIYINYKKKFKWIYSIEKLDYKEKSTCIKIDSIDSLYVTRDFILTHNTKVAIDVIKKGNFKNILITSPRTNLKDNWSKELEKWGVGWLFGDIYTITVENIQTCYKWNKEIVSKFDLIIFDEVHTIVSPEYGKLIAIAKELNISRIGLTATPSLHDEFKNQFYEYYIPIVYEYYNSAEDGIINKRKYYIYKYELTDNYKVIAGTKLKPFNVGEHTQYAYLTNQIKKGQLLMASTGSRDWFNDAAEWAWKGLGTSSQKAAAMTYLNAIKQRKNFLWNLSSSADIAIKIKERILTEDYGINIATGDSMNFNKVLLFSELTSQAEKLSAYSIHSKQDEETNKKILQMFDNGEIKELSSVRSLTLGLNLKGANWAIIESYNSSPTDIIQKMGRTDRLNKDDVANVVILVPRDTQANEWFNKFSESLDLSEAIYINNINEIKF